MKVLTSQLLDHFNGDVTTIATCWKITRSDGEVMGFTDHDVSLTIDGLKYWASSGYFRTAIANSAGTSVDNLQVNGFLDNDFITEDELRNGAYDFAEVEIFAVNWLDLSMGICRLRYGRFGEITIRPSGLFVVELRGLMQSLSQTVGETIIPECRADLGDARCKVKLVPDVRMSGKNYATGDRVIVPGDTSKVSISLPILNPQFDWSESTKYYSYNSFYDSLAIEWVFTNCVMTNYPLTSYTGTHYVRPTGPTGSARRKIPLDPADGPQEVEFGFYTRKLANNWQVGGLVELMFNGNVVGTLEIPYQETTLNEWVNVTQVFNPNLTGVDGFRITARWRPSTTNPNPTGIAQVQIDDYTFRMGSTEFDDGFMSFDQKSYSTTASLNWGTGNQTYPGNVNLLPVFGIAFLLPKTAVKQQTISLAGTGVINSEIDAGKYVASGLVYVGALEWGSTDRIRLQFKNASNAIISTFSTGFEDIRPSGMWHIRTFKAAVPPLTRSITILLDAGLTAERQPSGSPPSTAYDKISVDLINVDADETDNFSQFGGVEYQALSAGVTSLTVPTFTQTLGETVIDGELSWQCVTPKFTFMAEIGTVESNMEFYLPDLDVANAWFTWGVLHFLDGDNIGRGIEVESWDNTTKKMTLMFPTFSPITTGTHIRVHSGCDKSRGSGGCLRYNNILNYRGEPEVPGTGQYFKVGGT